MRHVLTVSIVLATLASPVQDRVQLKDLRSHFVGQRIIVNPDFSGLHVPFLSGWHWVKEKKGGYRADFVKQVPASFVGRAGTIIAVQAPDARFGETPADQSDNAFVDYGEAVVKLDSGELVQTALYSVYLKRDPGASPSDAFTLASLKERHQQEAAALAQKLTGKTLYLTRLTRIFDMGLPTADIQTAKAGIGYSQGEIINYPLLEPIPVLETRYSAERDYTLVVLQLPDNRKALYVPGCIEDAPTTKKYSCAMTAMPDFLSAHEVEAIRKGIVFVGMSEPAVYMSIGFPKDTNKSAVGLTQLVYLTAYVYLDNQGKVVEIQDHE